jgi:hypothetical protein
VKPSTILALAVTSYESDSNRIVLVRLDGSGRPQTFAPPASGPLSMESTGTLGYCMLRADDLDGDSIDDLILGAPTEMVRVSESSAEWTARGRVHLVSAGKLTTIASLDCTDCYGSFGAYAWDVGDLDQDGRADFAVGTVDVLRGISQESLWDLPVYSSRTRALLYRLRIDGESMMVRAQG